MTAQPETKPQDETVIQFPADADIARSELARLQKLARQYRKRAAKAEESGAKVRAATYVADFWRSALSGQGNAAAAHALAMVGAALNGERDPNELGLDADEHAAFRAAIAEEPTP